MAGKTGNLDSPPVAVIVTTYNEPRHLERCLLALSRQEFDDFELIIADDGSGEETREVIEQFGNRFERGIRHLWHEDKGFRKTLIVNKAIASTGAEYLVFVDGDCVVPPHFVAEHVDKAEYGFYLNGAVIRLDQDLTEKISPEVIETGKAFDADWLKEQGGKWDRRYLKLSLGYKTRNWLNRHTPTKLFWLGGNSSCFRADAVAINGFNNRFSYGFEDIDFGNRLVNYGLTPATVRWTAVALHLEHERPYTSPDQHARNRELMTPIEQGGEVRTPDGLAELDSHDQAVVTG